MAGLWGIYTGLEMVIDLGYHNLEVETDSKQAANCILKGSYTNMVVGNLVWSIIELMNSFDRVKIQHIYREANNCANILAMEGKKLIGESKFFSEASIWMRNSLKKDQNSVCVSRVIPL
ncbi:uncharacterized protein LOC131597302 [Vicia villosa]|uniref:uncharacterized protein LOC131597302 n=1 Tax=Vicia villosa TaxID=3911 RepID=UPI00273A76FD|nr:uncharacterized protein LOC131597302 [Vicia villosa]